MRILNQIIIIGIILKICPNNINSGEQKKATYLNLDQTKDFHQNGYVIVKNFFNKEETFLLHNASKQDPAIRVHLYERKDSEG